MDFFQSSWEKNWFLKRIFPIERKERNTKNFLLCQEKKKKKITENFFFKQKNKKQKTTTTKKEKKVRVER